MVCGGFHGSRDAPTDVSFAAPVAGGTLPKPRSPSVHFQDTCFPSWMPSSVLGRHNRKSWTMANGDHSTTTAYIKQSHPCMSGLKRRVFASHLQAWRALGTSVLAETVLAQHWRRQKNHARLLLPLPMLHQQPTTSPALTTS